jgi:hypothetical protein
VADLDVRRSRTSPWAYALGGAVLLVAILLSFVLLGGRGDPERADAMERGELPHEPPTVGPATADLPAPGAPGEAHIPVVREAMVACTGHPVADEPFVRDCIDRFDGALTALMDRGGLHPAGAGEHLVAFREHARHVVNAPTGDPRMPALTRAALASLAETFAALLSDQPGPEVEEPVRQFRQAADRVRADVPLDVQDEVLRHCFDLAVGLLGVTSRRSEGIA